MDPCNFCSQMFAFHSLNTLQILCGTTRNIRSRVSGTRCWCRTFLKQRSEWVCDSSTPPVSIRADESAQQEPPLPPNHSQSHSKNSILQKTVSLNLIWRIPAPTQDSGSEWVNIALMKAELQLIYMSVKFRFGAQLRLLFWMQTRGQDVGCFDGLLSLSLFFPAKRPDWPKLWWNNYTANQWPAASCIGM